MARDSNTSGKAFYFVEKADNVYKSALESNIFHVLTLRKQENLRNQDYS